MKVRRRLWGGGSEENDPKKYSVKYLGPEKAAAVLEKALQSVKVYMPLCSPLSCLIAIILYLRPQI